MCQPLFTSEQNVLVRGEAVISKQVIGELEKGILVDIQNSFQIGWKVVEEMSVHCCVSQRVTRFISQRYEHKQSSSTSSKELNIYGLDVRRRQIWNVLIAVSSYPEQRHCERSGYLCSFRSPILLKGEC